jgi:D-lyxose ketol-isomerase
MARYYFKIEGDEGRGTKANLDTLAEAKCEAVKLAGKCIFDQASTFWHVGDFTLTVTNERGLTLFTLRLYGTEAPAILP